MYYLPVGDFEGLFECSRVCLLQRASYSEVWNGEMAFYRDRVLMFAGPEHMEEFVEGVLGYQSLLNEVNERLLVDIVLTEENQEFINRITAGMEQGLTGGDLYDFITA